MIKEPKKPVFTQNFVPEAGLVIQNTPNIQEVYIEREFTPAEEKNNQEAFNTMINAKFKDFSKKETYRTIEFDTKQYYMEALRLSQHPTQYMREKSNPILRFFPTKQEFGII